MKRDFALRIDSLLTGVRASLDSIAHYMEDNVSRDNLTEEEYQKYVVFIGTSMGETVKLSRRLHEAFPDIVPDELKSVPPPKKP
jgi:hypothetical protein